MEYEATKEDRLLVLGFLNKVGSFFKSIGSWILKLWRAIIPYFRHFWVFIYILAFVTASQLTLRNNSKLGVYINALSLVALISLALMYSKARKLAISVSILPVATMVSLVLPDMSNFAQTIIFYDSILLLGLIYRYLFILDEPNNSDRMKLSHYAIFVPLMIIVGQVLGLIGYAMLRHHYPFDHTSLPLVAASAGVFAFTEETFFRGLIQQKGYQVLNPFFAGLLAVLIFALATIDHSTMLAPLFALILGSALCLTYYFKQNLILSGSINLATKLTYIGLMAAFVFR